MSDIRVLHVIHSMDCGGAENLIMNIYRVIDRNKVQFDFLVHTDKTCFFDAEIKSLGGKIYHAPYYKGWNYLHYKKAIDQFFDRHREFKVVHGHVGSCAPIYLQSAKEHGIFTIAHSHNTNPQSITIRNIVYRLGNLRTRQVADYFIGCSKAAGRDRFGKKIITSNRYQLLNNAIDTKQYTFSPETRRLIRKQFNLNDDEYVIGHVGRFEEQKNHEYLLEIFQSIQKINKKTKLLLVGDGSLRRNIEEKAKKAGIYDHIIFAGLRNDVQLLLQAMDCFVLPSLYEGLPLVMVEAQAAGLQCFISDKVPVDCIITKNVHIIHLEEKPNVWTKNILACIDVPRCDMTEDIKKAGFDIQITANHLQELYLLNSNRNIKGS